MNKGLLPELAVGDLVIVSYAGGPDAISAVDRLTKTLIIVNHFRFRKADWTMFGGTRDAVLKEATQENLKKVKYEIGLMKYGKFMCGTCLSELTSGKHKPTSKKLSETGQ